MAIRTISDIFICPLCEAEFKVVRLEAASNGPDFAVFCPACETEFPTRDGSNILKYFLVGELTPDSKSKRQRAGHTVYRKP